MKSILILSLLTLFTSVAVFSKSEEIQLEKINMFNDMVTIKVPSSFTVMHDYEVKKMYAADNLPKVVHADTLRTTRLAFSFVKITKEDVRLAARRANYLSNWQKVDPKLKIVSEELSTVDGRDMASLGVLHKSPEKVYRFLFFTEYKEIFLWGELISPKKGYKDWIVIGNEIMNSFHINYK